MEQDSVTKALDESAPRAEPDLVLRTAFEEKLSAFIRRGLKLGDDVVIAADVDLATQIGLDSIEAFDAVATMHELMLVSIPDDFNPRTVTTLRSLSDYVILTFGDEVAKRFLGIDLNTIEFNRTDDL